MVVVEGGGPVVDEEVGFEGGGGSRGRPRGLGRTRGVGKTGGGRVTRDGRAVSGTISDCGKYSVTTGPGRGARLVCSSTASSRLLSTVTGPVIEQVAL